MVLINWKFNQHFKEEDSNSEIKFFLVHETHKTDPE